MSKHLSLVISHSEANKMTVENMALIFGPTFMVNDSAGLLNMRGEFECIKSLILYHEWIFS
jgi:hypothetical protein